MLRDDTLEALEYVLALHGVGERRSLELALLDEPGLAATVWEVEERLAPLGTTLRPRKPAARVWRELQRKIAPAGMVPSRRLARRRVAFWRTLAGFFGVATVGALCVVAVMALRPEAILPPAPALVAPLAAADGSIALARILDDGSVVAEPLTADLADGRQAALWLVDEGGVPRALGVLSPGVATVLPPNGDPVAAGDRVGLRLDVTAEPEGSTLGAAPTGETIASGTLRAL